MKSLQIMHPERYHGRRARPPFFEGWYYKLIDATGQEKLAVIPGIILGQDAHAFIQVLDGSRGQTAYYRYPVEAFRAAPDALHLWVGDSQFWAGGLRLALSGGDLPLQGEVHLGDLAPWPVRWWSPGIMGPFAWLPFMECYHGVLSFDHALHGHLRLGQRRLDFEGGRGYIEKDWGRAFPQAWVWMQSNHFAQTGVSFTASIAVIPWLGSTFPGFIIGLWLAGRLVRFATYTGARTLRLAAEEGRVAWQVQDRRYRLEITAQRSQAGELKGPDTHQMGRRVLETLTAEIHLRLLNHTGDILFEGLGRHAGLEVQLDSSQNSILTEH